MEIKEMQEALDNVKSKIDEKVSKDIKDAVTNLETKFNEALESGIKEATKDMQDELKKVQDHADALDVKLQKKETKELYKGDFIKELIKENFDSISSVQKTGKVNIEYKAVGDMTLSNNFSGVQPRTQSSTVATIPNQILNFSDLIDTINIGNGTYEFPREGAGEGTMGTPAEGADKNQVDTDITMVPVPTDFIAGYTRYSKKMANNLPFLESFLPGSLRRKYFDAENSDFNTKLVAAATASAVTTGNFVERLMSEKAALASVNFPTTGFVVSPAAYDTILKTTANPSSAYSLPGGVTIDGNGMIRVAGIPLLQANWLADANKYFVGDWTTISKVVTEALSLEFSREDGTNFRSNNITARIESQVGLAIHRPDAIIYGDFTSV